MHEQNEDFLGKESFHVDRFIATINDIQKRFPKSILCGSAAVLVLASYYQSPNGVEEGLNLSRIRMIPPSDIDLLISQEDLEGLQTRANGQAVIREGEGLQLTLQKPYLKVEAFTTWQPNPVLLPLTYEAACQQSVKLGPVSLIGHAFKLTGFNMLIMNPLHIIEYKMQRMKPQDLQHIGVLRRSLAEIYDF